MGLDAITQLQAHPFPGQTRHQFEGVVDPLDVRYNLLTLTVSSHRMRSPARPDTSLKARSSIISVCSAFLRKSSFWASFSSYCCFNSAILASTYNTVHTDHKRSTGNYPDVYDLPTNVINLEVFYPAATFSWVRY